MNLVVFNGSSAIARSVVKQMVTANPGKYANVRILD